MTREMSELDEWKQAAGVEAGLRREFLARAEKAEIEVERQQADIDKMLAERQGWLDEIEQLRAALKLARCYMPVGAEIYDSDIQSAVDFVEAALGPKIQK